jgi:PAS domain S-box-containing protein
MDGIWQSLTEGFMPHGYCLRWDGPLLFTFIAGNLGIALAYFMIPIALWYFVRERRDLPCPHMFRLFAAFILACGLTHVAKVLTIWQPAYWLEASIDVATAVISLTTAMLLWPLVPKILALRSPSELEHANKQLGKANELFASLFELAPDAIVLVDSSGSIISTNIAAQSMFGYLKDELSEQSVELLLPSQFNQWHVEHGNLHLPCSDVPSSDKEAELYGRRKDGSAFPVDVMISSLNSHGDRMIMAIVRDMTERIRTQDELESLVLTVARARDEAVQANKLKSQFVANVSHEIRTPMSGVIGFAELIQEAPELSAETREAAHRMFESSRELLRVLNDLLDFSKLEAGRMTVEADEFSLPGIIDEVKGLSEPAAKAKGLELSSWVDPALPAFVNGDGGKIRQVLLNLAHNAVKFTRSGSIKIAAAVDRRNDESVSVRFAVIDTGIGITAAVQQQLFEPFVQADPTSKRQFGGTGLGLSISKRFVELLGGEIGLSSEVGKGSEFWFSLPLQARTAEDGQLATF